MYFKGTIVITDPCYIIKENPIKYPNEKDFGLPASISSKPFKDYSTPEELAYKAALDYYYKDFDISLAELISDNNINNPLINMTSKETAKTLEKAINARLTPTEKDVYELLIGGLNNNQIAKILKKTPKTTANTIQRIKKKVSDIVKNMYM